MTDVMIPAVARRPHGKAGHLTAEEKQAIGLAYLEAGGQVTNVALAAHFHVNRDTIAGVLKSPEFEELRQEFQQQLRSAAADRLRASVVLAAEQWREAIPIAAKKGDHRPSRDLLLHTGVIDPVSAQHDSGVTVIVGGGGQVNIGIAMKSVESESSG